MSARSLLAAAALSMLPAAAFAGSCPEEHVLTEPREIKQVAGQGVSVEVREQLTLSGWREMGDFRLRTRHFVIAPGGTVATHSHGDRPAIIYFVSGEIVEHSALCAVPILHKAGETTAEFGADHKHWWENVSDEPVVLVSSDVVPFKP